MHFSKFIAAIATVGVTLAQFTGATWAVIILDDASYLDDAGVAKRAIPAENIISVRSIDEAREKVAAREDISVNDIIVASSLAEAEAIHNAHTHGTGSAILTNTYLARLALKLE